MKKIITAALALKTIGMLINIMLPQNRVELNRDESGKRNGKLSDAK